ncbi:MAG: phosphonoacetaldehyde reductase [Lachnospiraceae bacterium]|nr:phosphonoacetaldehyde reductase [Lachnospiraceae bacterium]
MSEQRIGSAKQEYGFLYEWLKKYENEPVMLVCGTSFDGLDISHYLKKYASEWNIPITRFGEFAPNPDYASVEKGVAVFNENHCSALIAVGGGSAMDVAKCIKLYHTMDRETCFLEQTIIPNTTELFAVPTTAGTGSEATRYAVIYYKGEKQSVAHESCIPGFVLFDPSVLTTLNDYHRKASMLDALCHAIESFWSVNSTAESMDYSAKAIRMIYENAEGYLKNRPEENENMLQAAYLAGKAINITQTTAGHAMCYKLTSLYQLAHGFAAAVCTSRLWLYMLENMDNCVDSRGKQHLTEVFRGLAKASGCRDEKEAAQKFFCLVTGLTGDLHFDAKDMDCLVDSVNPVRLKNHPVKLEKEDIKYLYGEIFKGEG